MISGQEDKAYQEFFANISETPESYEAHTVAVRMIDGLGFRFYWGTHDLSDEDYLFKPTEDTRGIGETLDHILGLSSVILNAVHGRANGAADHGDIDYHAKRLLVLCKLYEARMILNNSTDEDMTDMAIIFKRGDSERRFDFWYAINGPISDSLWHVGQIVSYRRMAGNPFNSKVSVLSGTVRN
jgi:hypothetical protein